MQTGDRVSAIRKSRNFTLRRREDKRDDIARDEGTRVGERLEAEFPGPKMMTMWERVG